MTPATRLAMRTRLVAAMAGSGMTMASKSATTSTPMMLATTSVAVMTSSIQLARRPPGIVSGSSRGATSSTEAARQAGGERLRARGGHGL